jgi:hypothetical protein
LTLAQVGVEWSTSRPGRFTPGEGASGTHWIGGTSYETLHYAAFSNLLSLHSSLFKMFSLTFCSQTPSVYVVVDDDDDDDDDNNLIQSITHL